MSIALENGAKQRCLWIEALDRIATPLLELAADGKLASHSTIRCSIDNEHMNFGRLESVGRLISGIAPWLELTNTPKEERDLQSHLRTQAIRANEQGVRENGPDAWAFDGNQRVIVDGAYIAHALVRAPNALLNGLNDDVRTGLLKGMMTTHRQTPVFNNWLLFAAMIELGIARLGGESDMSRVEYAIRQHEQWYLGDGIYSDGPALHIDYYKSFVIHPMLHDVATGFVKSQMLCSQMLPDIRRRSGRCAAILERMISPEGTFPPVGRSITYRFGALHALSHAVLCQTLPEILPPAQARCGMTAVLERFLTCQDLFDSQGLLNVGFCGSQPQLAESYLANASQYMFAQGFVALG